MNAVYFNTRGGPEALVYGSATMPGAGEGEIVVRVRAAAVTPTELLWVTTWTTRAGEPRLFPIIPGHEFSGEVHGVGPGVNDVAVGEAVFGMNDFFGDGAQAEFCVARTVDDVVFDTVGGDTLARSWAVLRLGGTMVTTAADAEHTREQRVKDAFFIVEPNREQLTRISRMIDAGKLLVFVGAAFPLQEASQAYAHKPVRGKNVLVVDR